MLPELLDPDLPELDELDDPDEELLDDDEPRPPPELPPPPLLFSRSLKEDSLKDESKLSKLLANEGSTIGMSPSTLCRKVMSWRCGIDSDDTVYALTSKRAALFGHFMLMGDASCSRRRDAWSGEGYEQEE